MASLPPYVLATVDELKSKLRAQGHDVFDFGLGNPDGPSPAAALDRLTTEARRPGNQRFQLALQNLFFYELLKLRHRQVIALDEILVGGFADELAVGEQHGAELAMLKFVSYVLVSRPQTKAIGLKQYGFLVD